VFGMLSCARKQVNELSSSYSAHWKRIHLLDKRTKAPRLDGLLTNLMLQVEKRRKSEIARRAKICATGCTACCEQVKEF
jgi:hypothetical protein